MKRTLVELLRCPKCGSDMLGLEESTVLAEIDRGTVVCQRCGSRFEIANGIPRFVLEDDYSHSFSMQWHRWRVLQHSVISNVPIFEHRFREATGLDEASLCGRLVLDAGCGNGPYLGIMRQKGATVVGVDLSYAVEVAYEHYGRNEGIHIIQGDVYRLPLTPRAFDVVFCLGVIQHLPRPLDAVRLLLDYVKPGGLVVLGAYEAVPFWRLRPKYVLRTITSRLTPEFGMRFIPAYVELALRYRKWVGRIPVVGEPFSRLLPLSVPEASERHHLMPDQLRAWIELGTYDMLLTKFDRPQSPSVLEGVIREAGFERVTRNSKWNCFRARRPT